MTAIRLIRRDDCPAVPWKNGGGTTREIAAYPPGASLDDFQWRLSMAHVAAPGAFSHFAGVDRVIAILKGVLALAVDGGESVRLDDQSPPFRFAGDATAFGAPIYGDVLDLNLMVRRGGAASAMHRTEAGVLPQRTGTAILFALDDCTLGIGDETVTMQRHDSYLFGNGCDATLSVDHPAILVLIA